MGGPQRLGMAHADEIDARDGPRVLMRSGQTSVCSGGKGQRSWRERLVCLLLRLGVAVGWLNQRPKT